MTAIKMQGSSSNFHPPKFDLGIVGMFAGLTLASVADRDISFPPIDTRYTASMTVGSATPMSYRVSSANTAAVALALFVENFAARQTGFDTDIAKIVSDGWDELFD